MWVFFNGFRTVKAGFMAADTWRLDENKLNNAVVLFAFILSENVSDMTEWLSLSVHISLSV